MLPHLEEFEAFARALGEGKSGAEAVCSFWGILPKWTALHPTLQALVDGMLQIDPTTRWTLSRVQSALEGMERGERGAELPLPPKKRLEPEVGAAFAPDNGPADAVWHDPMDDDDDLPPVWRAGPGNVADGDRQREGGTVLATSAAARVPPRIVRTREGGVI